MAKKPDLSEEPWSLGDCMYKIQKAEENMAKKKKKIKTKRKTSRKKIPIHGSEGKMAALIQKIDELEKRVKTLERRNELLKRNGIGRGL